MGWVTSILLSKNRTIHQLPLVLKWWSWENSKNLILFFFCLLKEKPYGKSPCLYWLYVHSVLLSSFFWAARTRDTNILPCGWPSRRLMWWKVHFIETSNTSQLLCQRQQGDTRRLADIGAGGGVDIGLSCYFHLIIFHSYACSIEPQVLFDFDLFVRDRSLILI